MLLQMNIRILTASVQKVNNLEVIFQREPKEKSNSVMHSCMKKPRDALAVTYILYYAHLQVFVAFCDHPQAVEYNVKEYNKKLCVANSSKFWYDKML
jgi:hypothetical protein